MNEFQVAMGICNLRHVEVKIAKRKAAVAYLERLSGVANRVIRAPSWCKSNYAFSPLFDGYKLTVMRSSRSLKQKTSMPENIYPSQTACYMIVLMTTTPCISTSPRGY